MGNGLSVSSIVDQLHVLEPAERSEALDKLYKQHDEIRAYLKSRCHPDLVAGQKQQSVQLKLKQPHLQAIHIKKVVPEEQKLTEKERSTWDGDPCLFWTSSSHSFLPSENCQEPLRFVLDATSQIEQHSHENCLQRRYLALFWFDCFTTRYPKQETAFDHEYLDLGRHILGPAVVDSDARVSRLRRQVKAGRKYNMLTTKFADGILLTLPSSIGWSTLERKMPLDQGKFDTWIGPVVGSLWEEQSKREDICDLGRRIRQIILQRCLPNYANSPTSPWKRRQKNTTVATAHETVSTAPSVAVRLSASSIIECTLPQAHRIHSLSSGAFPGRQRCKAKYPASQGQNVQATPQDVENVHRILSTDPAVGVSSRTYIPPLFYAMGNDIPKVLVDRAVSPQARWSEHGEFEEITPQDAGLHQDLVCLLSNETRFNQQIEELVSQSMIREERSTGGFQTYTYQSSLGRKLYNLNRAYWIHRGFELCCYVFPRDQILESSFGLVGRQLLHVLQHLLRLMSEIDLEIPARKDAVEALVAASKFGKMSNRKDLLKIATELHKDPGQTDTQAMIVHRNSVLLRLCSKISESQRVIQQFLCRPLPQPNPRLHSLLGLLHLSQAENWAYQFNHQRVYNEAQKWGPGDDPSAMQLYVLRTKLKLLGQSYKGEGLFENARSAFEGCLAAMKPQDSERFLIKSHLADVFCELEYLKRKDFAIPDLVFLDEAKRVVGLEIEQLRTSSRHPRHLRRLLLSLLEIEIICGRQSVAECLIDELLVIYNSLTEHDINDQVGHVRTLTAWARISEPSEAVVRWHTALHWNKIYNPSEEDVFTCGVIYLFISLAYFKIGNNNESWASFNRAAEIINRKQPQFLIPGVGTYLYDLVRRELRSLAGWLVPGKAL